MNEYSDYTPIIDQMQFVPDIVASLVQVWKQSEAGTMRITQPPSEDALRGMRYEIDRICNKFTKATPAELAAAIREAANTALDNSFQRLTIRLIETEAQLIERKRSPLELPMSANKWSGTPEEALDRNWPEIWAKSVAESIKAGEKRRCFDHDYLQIWDSEADKAAAKIRERAFLQLKKRVLEDPRFDSPRAMLSARKMLYELLLTCYPRYKGDIERQIWAVEYDNLNALCAEIHGLESTNRGTGKWQQMPNIAKVEWCVFFDLYAEMKGCKWPELKAKEAPKQDQAQPKPRWTAVPKDLDSMNV